MSAPSHRGISKEYDAYMRDLHEEERVRHKTSELFECARQVLRHKGTLVQGVADTSKGASRDNPDVYVRQGTPPVEMKDGRSIALHHPVGSLLMVHLVTVPKDDNYLARNYNHNIMARIGPGSVTMDGMPTTEKRIDRIQHFVEYIGESGVLPDVPGLEKLVALPVTFKNGKGPETGKVINLLNGIPPELLTDH